MIPKDELQKDLDNVTAESKKSNRNPWMPYEYTISILESHLALYEKFEALEKKLHPRCDCELEQFIDDCYKD